MRNPRQFGQYEPVGLLRSGGGGTVYRARDTHDGTLVALKVAHAASPAAVSSLRREVATLLALNDAAVHGVVRLLASGVGEQIPWFAMEFLEGTDLGVFRRNLWEEDSNASSAWAGLVAITAAAGGCVEAPSLDQRPKARPAMASAESALSGPRLRSTLEVGIGIAETLRQVHDLGLLHGDLTPSNIVLRDSGQPVLLDFGTSFAVFEPTQFREPARLEFRSYGTPGYAAPELLRGDSVDLRCDIYGLGCILFELFFGRALFAGASRDDVIRQHLYGKPSVPRLAGVPLSVSELLLRMVAKAADERLADVQPVIDALSTLLDKPRSTPKAQPRLALLRPRYVGHHGCLEQVLQRLAASKQGETQSVLITAPSGAGKSRLLNELGTFAVKHGAAVISCVAASTHSSNETKFSNPGLSLLEPLRQHAEQVLRQVTAGTAAGEELASWQEVGATLHLQGSAAGSVPGTELLLGANEMRQRIFDALEQLLRLLAARQPLVVLFDDLQWADKLSLTFLAERVKRITDSQLLLVAAARNDAEPDEIGALRSSASLGLDLPPLAHEQSGELVKSLLGAEALPEGLLDYLDSRAEGNPFFIGEYLRAALARGLLRKEKGGRWHFPTPTELRRHTLDVPRNVDEVITARMATLSETARQLLSHAAVLGREFDEDVLMVQMADAELATARALQELVANQMLAQLAAGRYRFAHDRIREAAEQGLPSVVRQRLHRRAAEALEASPSERDTSMLARLGYHWAAAGEPVLALPHLDRAAALATEENDIDFACELYRVGIAQAQKAEPEQSPAMLVRLNESLGEALVLRARHAEARQCYAEAFAIAVDPLLRARIKRKEAATYWTQHDCAIADAMLRAAEQELGLPESESSIEVWQEHIQIRLGRFECLYFSGQRGAQMDELVDSLEEPVRKFATARQRNSYYVASSSHHLLRNRYAYQDKAVELAWLAVQASDGLTLDRRALGQLAYGFSLYFGTRAQCREALPYLEFAAEAARHAKATTLWARCTTYRTFALVRLREIELVERSVQELRAAAEAAGIPPYIAAASAVLGWLDWRRGQPSAPDRLGKARTAWLTHKQPFPFRWVAGFPLLSLAQAQDDFEFARCLLDDLLHPTQQALPEALIASIDEAVRACDAEDFVATDSRVTTVLRLAEELGYC